MKKATASGKRAVRQPRYLVDDRGGKVGVLIDIQEYERMREAEEELAAIRAFDAAKASGEKPVPLKEAFRRHGGRGR
jgi:PHD/YefM family antitoxin component YafN of YafNO toxin-antitoxin module